MNTKDAAAEMRCRMDRAAEMLRIAAQIIREHAPEQTHEYDGIECDGICIADDCEAAAEAIAP